MKNNYVCAVPPCPFLSSWGSLAVPSLLAPTSVCTGLSPCTGIAVKTTARLAACRAMPMTPATVKTCAARRSEHCPPHGDLTVHPPSEGRHLQMILVQATCKYHFEQSQNALLASDGYTTLQALDSSEVPSAGCSKVHLHGQGSRLL